MRVLLAFTVVATLATNVAAAEAPMTKSQARALANSLKLGEADMPGYSATPHVVPAKARRLEQRFLDCAGAIHQKQALADVSSDDYAAQGDNAMGASSVTSRVIVMPSRGAAIRDLRALNSARARACLRKLNNGVIVTGDERILSSTTTKLVPPVPGTAETRAVVRVSTGQETESLIFDGIAYRRGGVEIALGTASINEPFDSTEEQRLAELLVTRAQQQVP